MTNDTDLQQLLNRIVDGLASEADDQCLANLLRSDPKSRQIYREFMALHSALHWDYAAAVLPEAVAPPTIPSPPVAPFPRTGLLAAFVAGVLVASAAAIGFFLLRPTAQANGRTESHPAFARSKLDPANRDAVAAFLVEGVDAEFAPGRGPDGVRFGPGGYELVKGIVHLRFARGADMVLAAPARIEITDAQHTRLMSGKVRVVAPPAAKGFTIATLSADYVDLGTEFGLRVDAASGASDLYVFDGQVNVTDPQSGRVLPVMGGNSSRAIDGRPADAPPLKEGDFPTPGSIGLKRWEEYEQRMREDRTLLAFYPFQRQADEAVLVNSVNGGVGDGRITGARWTTGRWPGKDALLFDRDTDYAQVTIPGEHQELTIAAWVKIDRLDFVFNAMMNSDRYEAGGVHFQLNRQGFVRGGVILAGSFQETFVGKAVPLGQWVHVASVISARTRSQQIYVNGVLARERRWQSDVPLKPGQCRIGNWLADSKDTFPVRAFRGQIDELCAWRRVLSAEEVGRLVEAGRPGLQWTKD